MTRCIYWVPYPVTAEPAERLILRCCAVGYSAIGGAFKCYCSMFSVRFCPHV